MIFHFEIYILHLGRSSIARRARHGVPIEEWANELMYAVCLSAWMHGGLGKPSVNSAFIVYIRPEAKWACHEQGESRRKSGGGPNRLAVQYYRMTCGKKWKANRTW